MSRRTHRKTRNGCAECKRRHIRCDETRPICINCANSGRTCSFIDTTAPTRLRSDTASRTLRANTNSNPCSDDILDSQPAHPEPRLAVQNGSNDGLSTQHVEVEVNMEHMELLYHFYDGAWGCIHYNTTYKERSFLAMQEHAIQAPYLLHQMLAVSALYLSIMRFERQDYYKALADSLHARSLSLLKKLINWMNPVDELCLTILSSLIGIQSLYSTIRCHKDSLDELVKAFVQALRTYQGYHIITDYSKRILESQQSYLLWRLCDNFKIEHSTEATQPGTECAALKSMLIALNVCPSNLEAYNITINQLQRMFDTGKTSLTVQSHMIFAWPLSIPPRFVDCLAENRPEALAILAYYSVLLHHHSNLWMIGDSGKFLIESISSDLGDEWKEHLRWPLSAIEEQRESSPASYVRGVLWSRLL